ncbi:transient-receptor-potential-like protein isoform X2 [Ptychodera flava]|uniref:transient-receptor-potential-like protein isoform X2 n=1 Tax=Ptychodera flava TaxID=63121 RepID=UPI003969D161
MSAPVRPLVNLSESVRNYLGEQNRARQGVNKVAENFLTAVERGNHEEVKRLLESQEVDVNYKGKRRDIETTALQIAAERNDFYMVKLLFSKDAIELDKERILGPNKTIEEKIYAYGAISSPAYISIHYLCTVENDDLCCSCSGTSVKDCVQEAFELVENMKEFVRREKLKVWEDLFKRFNGYLQRLEDFTIELLNCCRTRDEVRWFLGGGFYNNTCNCIDFETCRKVMSCTYDRNPKHLITVEKAIETRQKKFISKDQIQRFLKTEWLRGQPKWSRNKGVVWRVLYAIFAFFVYGIFNQFVPVHICVCGTSRLHRLFYSPKSAFLSHYFHYAFFLLFIFWYQVFVSYKVEGSKAIIVSDINYVPILVLCIIWFVTLCIADIGQLMFQGPSRYFKNHWNILDVTILVSFFLGVIIGNPDIVGDIYDDPYTFIYLSKFTSLTFVCALLRFMEPFYLSYFVGPILLIFTEMRHDIFRFLVVFGYVVVSYALAMYYFYVDVGENQSKFARFPSSLSSLVFTIFGGDATESLTIEERIELMVSNGTAALSSPRTLTSYFIAVGYILYILFGIIVLIMLLNLCIAMMSDRYSQLHGEINLEWKFERSRIWMEYIGDRGSNSNVLSFIVYLLFSFCCVPFLCIRSMCSNYRKEKTHEEELRVVKTSDTVVDAGNENEISEQTDDRTVNAEVKEPAGVQEEEKPCPFPFVELLALLLDRYFEKYAKPHGEDSAVFDDQ